MELEVKEDTKLKIDRRYKLTLQQREEIKLLFNTGKISRAELALNYKVSWYIINYIVYPEKQKENYKKTIARGGSVIYYRRKKEKLNKNNSLKASK